MNNIFEQWWIWWDRSKSEQKDPLEFFEMEGVDGEQLLLDHQEMEIIIIVAEKSQKLSATYKSAFALIYHLYTTLRQTRGELYRLDHKHSQIVLKHFRQMMGRVAGSYVDVDDESDTSNTEEEDEEEELESN